MNLNQLLNSIGLTVNIVGVIFIFKYGFPQPSFEEGAGLGLEDSTILSNGKTVKENDNEIRKTKVSFKAKSYCGLTLIIIGFIFQLIATNI